MLEAYVTEVGGDSMILYEIQEVYLTSKLLL